MVRRDGTRFRGFALAVAIQMLALPVLARLGWVQLSIPAFYPLGAILGGYVFGLAMGWAGGCAASLWYKWGSDDWGLGGMIAGAAATEAGPLRWMREQVQQVGSAEVVRTATLGGLLDAEWVAYPPASLPKRTRTGLKSDHFSHAIWCRPPHPTEPDSTGKTGERPEVGVWLQMIVCGTRSVAI
ncbi:MAG: YeeE/YedE family protein [Candidatus Latescibacteria bacterium]|nr:YeeE/YedE family protein [Candidatus Latescibacterota bacterium]